MSQDKPTVERIQRDDYGDQRLSEALKDLATICDEMESKRYEGQVATTERTLSEVLKDLVSLVSDLELNDDATCDSSEHRLSEVLKHLVPLCPSNRNLFPAISQETLEPATLSWLSSELGYLPPEDSLYRHPSTLDAFLAQNLSPQGESPPSQNILKLKEARRKLKSWDFNPFDYNKDELLSLTVVMFEELGFIKQFNLDRNALLAFFTAIRQLYRDNPYHNFTHAFDVTQAVYVMLSANGAAFFEPIEQFGIMIAAIAHDLDHPGLNNNFQINTGSPLAERWNDQSVLENHHCSLLWSLLKSSNAELLKSFEPDERREIRRLTTQSILLTDMSKHVEFTSKFSEKIPALSGKVAAQLTKDDRTLLLCELLKCADISNVVRPIQICRRWAELVQLEFVQQGKRERECGLNVSPFMDSADKSARCKMEINFIDFVAVPTFSLLQQLLPSIQQCCTRLLENRDSWQAELETMLDTTLQLRWRRRSVTVHDYMKNASVQFEERARETVFGGAGKEPNSKFRRHSLASTEARRAEPRKDPPVDNNTKRRSLTLPCSRDQITTVEEETLSP
mmetsp:Transcript_52110/g.86666  ORF Transcript_52110/g.86666 Transcript_52110/m.86666 type:complete len:566 (+) Transcript_52110:64-1761(+)